ncbi:MAG: exopolysaccharide biosynthesis protein [Pseudohongiellaceae bacterium]
MESGDGELHNLEQMLERLKCNSGESSEVYISNMLEAVGQRSFGPILLLAGLIPASPLSAIPGVPSLAAALAFLVIVQLLTGHDHFWLPEWLLRRKIARHRFVRALNAMQKPARWIDRMIKPRLQIFATGPAIFPIAATCLVIALVMPLLEVIPMANTSTGFVLAIFGLAIISCDGMLVLLGAGIIAALVIAGLTVYGG